MTLRTAEWVWNLRSRRAFEVFEAALLGIADRPGFRVTHFSVQGNHMHLLVEADSPAALATGVRALAIRLARGMNRMMARRGRVFEERYHAHVLRTPTEVRAALRYVVGNHASHAARRGEPLDDGWMDPYASASPRRDAAAQRSLFSGELTRPARGWLLRRATGR